MSIQWGRGKTWNQRNKKYYVFQNVEGNNFLKSRMKTQKKDRKIMYIQALEK